ncbi:MAG TPA: glycosyltransferase, partial [Candidatus Acidoferrum sp.]|nr:glycosyltransferase [Candidatus Acidoferrum sp.]
MPGERGTACLLVTNIFPPAMGGSSEVYAALASFAQGDIAVLTSSHDYETGLEREGWRAFDSQAPYPVHRVNCIRPYLRASRLRPGLLYRIHEALTAIRLAASVLRLALRYRVGAICIADDETVGWLTLAGRVLKVRTLIYCHGDDLKCAKESVPRRRRWFGLADRVVAASHYAARLLAAEFGVPADKVGIISNGVDLGAFFPQAVPRSFLQQHG